MRTTMALFVVLVCILSGCSKVYFTSDIRKELESVNAPLERIQFYNDTKVVLRREMETGKAHVVSGKIRVENGKYVNYIILKKGTPGVCRSKKDNEVGISFEHGDKKTLDFGVKAGMSGTSAYKIRATSWNDHLGSIQYEGKDYVIQAGGGTTRLMIKGRVFNRLVINKRTMKGVKTR